ncbi:hypothetical protein ACJX0J_004490 [Zea mays]
MTSCISFFLLHPKSSFLDSFLQGNFEIQILKKRISRSIKIYAMNRPKIAKLTEEIALLATLIICSNIRRGNSIQEFWYILILNTTEPSLDFIFGPEASKSVPHKKVVLVIGN